MRTLSRPGFLLVAEEPIMPASQARYRPETQLVHAGTLRSQFGETSEALFLTQGYVYDSALSAEKRFKNEEPGYQYSRFSNPTVSMFEQRMAALEGAQAARATATGMAAVTTALMGQVRAGDHIVCRLLLEKKNSSARRAWLRPDQSRLLAPDPHHTPMS